MKKFFSSSKTHDSVDEEIQVVKIPKSKTPEDIHKICRSGDEVAVKKLIKRGVNLVQLIYECESSRVSSGQAPLLSIIESGNKKLIRYVLFELKLDPQRAQFEMRQDGRRHTRHEVTDAVVSMLQKFKPNEKILHEFLAMLGPERLNEPNLSYEYTSDRDWYEPSNTDEEKVSTIVECIIRGDFSELQVVIDALESFGQFKYQFQELNWAERNYPVIVQYKTEKAAKNAIEGVQKKVPEIIKVENTTQHRLNYFIKQALERM
jgi:hypothetical protein